MSPLNGRRFWKMTGSGNDFIFFDVRVEPSGLLEREDVIESLCARGTGIGADGVVLIQDDESQCFRIRYFNRDGSIGELCGNAALCTVRLAQELELSTGGRVSFMTDAGAVSGRVAGERLAEIDMPPIKDLRPDTGYAWGREEIRVGFADSGVPHLVVLVHDVETVPVMERGRSLRHHPDLAAGANVNFVSREAGGTWRIRTYERGVEGETLACGTGAAATAALTSEWGMHSGEIALQTRAGCALTVSFRDGARLLPTLRGEGRIVFSGVLADIDP